MIAEYARTTTKLGPGRRRFNSVKKYGFTRIRAHGMLMRGTSLQRSMYFVTAPRISSLLTEICAIADNAGDYERIFSKYADRRERVLRRRYRASHAPDAIAGWARLASTLAARISGRTLLIETPASPSVRNCLSQIPVA
jgi:hypothetical protein